VGGGGGAQPLTPKKIYYNLTIESPTLARTDFFFVK